MKLKEQFCILIAISNDKFILRNQFKIDHRDKQIAEQLKYNCDDNDKDI